MGTINLAGHSIPLWIIVVVAGVIAVLAFRRPRKRGRLDQVAAVSHQAVSWRRRAVLNHNEGLVYESALAVLEQLKPNWNVWPQVSLGEVVETQGRSDVDGGQNPRLNGADRPFRLSSQSMAASS